MRARLNDPPKMVGRSTEASRTERKVTEVKIIASHCIDTDKNKFTVLKFDPPERMRGRCAIVAGERCEIAFMSSPSDDCVAIKGIHNNLVGKELVFEL